MARVIPADNNHADTSAQWDGLWGCAAPELHRERLAGLGSNRSAPDAVLIRLLGYSGKVLDFLWRTDLPPAVVQAALDSPRWDVRGPILEQPWRHAIDPDQWVRLLNQPRAEAHRTVAVIVLCTTCGVTLPDGVIDRLVRDPRARVRAVAAELPGVSPAQLAMLAADPDPLVRKAVVPLAWAVLDAAARRAPLTYAEPPVRAAALLCHHQDPDRPMPVEVFDALPDGLARLVAEHCALTGELFRRLADHDQDRWQRVCLAENPNLTAEQVASLSADADPEVRRSLSTRPELTEQQRAAIPLEITEHTMSRTLPWIAAQHQDPEAMRRLARSAHPLIRRSVARAAHLPADVVAYLAQDPDRTVRLFLAESCQDATPEVLLSVAAWWSGSLSHPDSPRRHPNFPRTGLLRLARDPNPLLRRLALDDPDSDAAMAEQFADDPHETVRARAAVDPRLSPDTLQRLLDEPDMHALAAGNPSLPVAHLVHLLRSPRSARAAATNLRIPAAVMHHMINEASALETTTSP